MSVKNELDVAESPLRVGVWDDADGSIGRALEAGSTAFDVHRYDSMPSHMEVVSVDALVASPDGDADMFRTFYTHVRKTVPEKPLVVVGTGSDGPIHERIEADERTTRIPTTGNGIPPALLAARITRLSNHDLPGAPGEPLADRTPAYRRNGREFYGLWGGALLTYGLGDFLSTILAVYTVPGLYEGNPVIATVLAHTGILGFLAVKVVVFLGALGLSVRGANVGDRLTYYAPPLLISAFGIVLTVWNLSLIVTS